jgi:hypothetical protein
MAKTIVIVSTKVDNTVKEFQRDVNFLMFRSIEDLDHYVETTPIRAEVLYFTKDVLPRVNVYLEYLESMLKRTFFKVDRIVYITEKSSSEVTSVKFLIQSKGYSNWEIIEGTLTRDYVSSIINGKGRKDISAAKRKAVYRMPREAYVAGQLKNIRELQGAEYEDDDAYLGGIPDESIPVQSLPERDQVCQLMHVAGLDCEERTLMVFLFAQYLSLSSKVLILERDFDYHRMTEYVMKSGLDVSLYEVDAILTDPYAVIKRIRDDTSNFICVISTERVEYDYSFVFNLLYNNLYSVLDYAVREDDFDEVPDMINYTAIVPADIVNILKSCEQINMTTVGYGKFVGVCLQKVFELQFQSSRSFTEVLQDVLDVEQVNSCLVAIDTLKLDNYDMRSVLN